MESIREQKQMRNWRHNEISKVIITPARALRGLTLTWIPFSVNSPFPSNGWEWLLRINLGWKRDNSKASALYSGLGGLGSNLGWSIILRDLTSLVGNNSYSASFSSGVHTGIGYCQGNLNLMLKMIKNYLPWRQRECCELIPVTKLRGIFNVQMLKRF